MPKSSITILSPAFIQHLLQYAESQQTLQAAGGLLASAQKAVAQCSALLATLPAAPLTRPAAPLPLCPADFYGYSTATARAVLQPVCNVSYFQFARPPVGYRPHMLMTARGVAVGDAVEDGLLEWYRGIPCFVGGPVCRTTPDIAKLHGQLQRLGSYSLTFVMWCVNDMPVEPAAFWALVDNGTLSPAQRVDYCELKFHILDGIVSNIETICCQNTRAHLPGSSYGTP